MSLPFGSEILISEFSYFKLPGLNKLITTFTILWIITVFHDLLMFNRTIS